MIPKGWRLRDRPKDGACAIALTRRGLLLPLVLLRVRVRLPSLYSATFVGWISNLKINAKTRRLRREAQSNDMGTRRQRALLSQDIPVGFVALPSVQMEGCLPMAAAIKPSSFGAGTMVNAFATLEARM